ncbi:MAG: GNAT family N-acetyltransferase [Thermomicrobiales bacterium]
MRPNGIVLRPQTDADRDFLHALYGSTRADELAIVPWTDEQKAAFIAMQFRAQSAHYAEHYYDADLLIIERDGTPIGRLYLHRGDREIRIVDIALVPEARGAGLGTHLLQDILAEGARTGKSVSIHVERFNPALRLYRRLGFAHVEENGVYYLMRWTPNPADGDQPKIA